jgi:hypothetical protein
MTARFFWMLWVLIGFKDEADALDGEAYLGGTSFFAAFLVALFMLNSGFMTSKLNNWLLSVL